jgi:hypothetical protein
MKMEQSLPKRRHVKLRPRGTTQQREYNIHIMAQFEINNYYYVHFMQMMYHLGAVDSSKLPRYTRIFWIA